MEIIKVGSIDWKVALPRLSIGGFYLLNVMWRLDVLANDCALKAASGMGVSTYRKYKKELEDNHYLTVEQVGKATYQYTLKDSNGY